MKVYPKCFVAAEFVAVLAKHTSMSRPAAVQWGRRLLDLGVIECAMEKAVRVLLSVDCWISADSRSLLGGVR